MSLLYLSRLRCQLQSFSFTSVQRRYCSLTGEEWPQQLCAATCKTARVHRTGILAYKLLTAKCWQSSEYSTAPSVQAKAEPAVDSQKIKHGVEAIAEALRSGKTLFNLGREYLLPAIQLRDACRCSQCVDPSTQQRNFSFVDIPENVRAIQEGIRDGSYTFRWDNDISGFSDHVSSFSLDDLKTLAEDRTTISTLGPGKPMAWDSESIKGRLVTMSYEAYMDGGKGLWTAIQALQRDGLIFIKGVPSNTDSVNKLVERIGPLRNSFYGLTWDVQSKPSADNVAYTDKDLGFHMDLLYMNEPPAFQYLHCIQNTCTGGESLFADTRSARDIMYSNYLEQAQALEQLEIKYHYRNLGQAYENSWKVFGEHGTTFWSPPFVERFGSKGLDDEQVHKALLAAKRFASTLERRDLVYETKMEEGTCAIFQNTRVVHARNGFDVNSGHRWLRGAYLDSQPVQSMYAHLSRQFSSEK